MVIVPAEAAVEKSAAADKAAAPKAQLIFIASPLDAND
jgi:hypothetical protein